MEQLSISKSRFLTLLDEFPQKVELKDRKYKLKTYKSCFVGREAVTWLVENNYAANREEAVVIGNLLRSRGVFVHVVKEHPFEDKYLFYKLPDKIVHEDYLSQYSIGDIVQLSPGESCVVQARETISFSDSNMQNDGILQLLIRLEGDANSYEQCNKYLDIIKKRPHPNICAIKDYALEPKRAMFTYQTIKEIPLLPGLIRRWTARYNESPLLLHEAIRATLSQVGKALHHLHTEVGVAYGRLIPSFINFLTDPTPASIKVTLTCIGQAVTAQFLSGVSTPQEYLIPPEYIQKLQHKKRRAFTREPISDSWSFGVLMHVLLVGTIPFPNWHTEAVASQKQFQLRTWEQLRSTSLITKASWDLISRLLCDKSERLTIDEIFQHRFFAMTQTDFLEEEKDWYSTSARVTHQWGANWHEFYVQTSTKRKVKRKCTDVFFNQLMEGNYDEYQSKIYHIPILSPFDDSLTKFMGSLQKSASKGQITKAAFKKFYMFRWMQLETVTVNERYFDTNSDAFCEKGDCLYHFTLTNPDLLQRDMLLQSAVPTSKFVMFVTPAEFVSSPELTEWFGKLFCSTKHYSVLSSAVPVIGVILDAPSSKRKNLEIALQKATSGSTFNCSCLFLSSKDSDPMVKIINHYLHIGSRGVQTTIKRKSSMNSIHRHNHLCNWMERYDAIQIDHSQRTDDIDKKEFAQLISYLDNPALHVIDLRYWPLKPSMVETLSYQCCTCSKLLYLNLSNCTLGNEGVSFLAQNMTKSKIGLKCLVLVSVGCDDPPQSLLNILYTSSGELETLDLSENHFGDQGVAKLAAAIANNTVLKSLRLCFVGMKFVGASKIALMLKENCHLSTLNIEHNTISSNGIIALEQALLENSSSSLINFVYSEISLRTAQMESIQSVTMFHGTLFEQRKSETPHFTIQPDIPTTNSRGYVVNFSEEHFNSLKAPELSNLLLNKNALRKVPKISISNFSNLRGLYLVDNQLNSLENLEELYETLTILDLSCNQFTTIPETVTFFKKLQTLSMRKNLVREVPRTIENCENLLFLDLSANHINQIQINLFSNQRPIFIKLTSNPIPLVKRLIYEAFFTQASYLDLQKLDINWIPFDIQYLRKLSWLNISGNPMKQFPPQLLQLGNQLSLISAKNPRVTYTELRTFHKLYVHKSEYQELPVPAESRAGPYNELSVITKQLRNEREKSKQVIFKVYHTGKVNPLVNFVLSQYGEVSQATKQIRHSSSNISVSCECAQPHRQIEIVSFQVDHPDSSQNSNFFVRMWNLCEFDLLTVQLFNTTQGIYLIYFDLSEALEPQVINYLQSIYSASSNPSILLLGYNAPSNLDGEQLGNECSELKRKGFPGIKLVITMDSSPESIEQLHKAIMDLYLETPSLAFSLTPADETIESLIAEEQHFLLPPIISLEILSRMAQTCQVPDFSEPKRIARLLNHLGSVIYIDDQHLGLDKHVLLRPEWLIEAVSELLAFKSEDGFIRQSDYNSIWKAPCFPESVHQYILKVLCKFEIACEIQSREEGLVHLIPTLLHPYRPFLLDIWMSLQDYSQPFNPTQPQLTRVINFPVIPLGFLSRLTVRLSPIFDSPARWRHGAIFVHGNAKCMIETSMKGENVTCTFRGTEFKDMVYIIRVVMGFIEQLLSLFQTPYTMEIRYFTGSASVGFINLLDKVSVIPLQDLEAAIVRGETHLGSGDSSVPIRDFAPDLYLMDLEEFLAKGDELQKEKEIGKGGFGTVFKATFRGELVATKEIDLSSVEKIEAINSFRREVFVTSLLNHENIVSLKCFCWNPMGMSLEFVKCGNLFDYLHSDAKIPWKLRIKMALDVANAMEYLHSKSPIIMHRDLKTPNCLIAGFSLDEVCVKVTDFGESVFLVHKYTGRDNLLNPRWLAPEILRGEDYNEMIDVYSFGMLLYELASRQLPFDEHEISNSPFVSLFEEHIIDGLRPSVPEGTPKPIGELMQICWDNDPLKRLPFTQVVSRLKVVYSEEN